MSSFAKSMEYLEFFAYNKMELLRKRTSYTKGGSNNASCKTRFKMILD